MTPKVVVVRQLAGNDTEHSRNFGDAQFAIAGNIRNIPEIVDAGDVVFLPCTNFRQGLEMDIEQAGVKSWTRWLMLLQGSFSLRNSTINGTQHEQGQRQGGKSSVLHLDSSMKDVAGLPLPGIPNAVLSFGNAVEFQFAESVPCPTISLHLSRVRPRNPVYFM